MKFGVISTANIAQVALIPAIQRAGHEVHAIGSRDRDRATAVAAEHGIERAYGSYEALLEDDEIDAIYNPLPNSAHAEWTKRAADHGLHVLCEKPLTVDATQAREVGEYCDREGVVLMEALMYRYHPRTKRAAEIVETEFDDVRSVTGAFHFYVGRDAELDRGSLLDVGCYPVTAVKDILGIPERVYGTMHDSRGFGFDTQTTALFEYSNGATAQISSGFDSPVRQCYRVDAETGWLEVENAYAPSPRSAPDGVDPVETKLRYEVNGRRVVETFDPVDQFSLEVEHFVECVDEGRIPDTDAEYAINTLRICDAIVESDDEGAPVALD